MLALQFIYCDLKFLVYKVSLFVWLWIWHPLTHIVQHKHGLIKINTSILGSVAISVSMHMESRITYLDFLDFYLIRISMCTNGITH